MNQSLTIDAVIVGGGIAGLWLLNTLTQQGFTAILIEKEACGGTQSLNSQGIIHGGMKYALMGKLSDASQALADMPNIWRHCLSGKGSIDLSQALSLSDYQWLWSHGSLGSKLAAFFASKTLASRMTQPDRTQWPSIFQSPDFRGQMYQLNERVLDIPSVIQALVTPVKDRIIQYDWNNAVLEREGNAIRSATLAINGKSLTLKAKQFILTAGEGNGDFLNSYHHQTPHMQVRPLHMVALTANNLPTLYAHCIQMSDKPRLTITTHRNRQGETIWYLGGNLAETGIHKTTTEQIAFAQQECATLIPWLHFSSTRWHAFMINRAEMQQNHDKRPDGPCFETIGNLTVAWPTKLAFAPLLSEKLMQKLFHETTPTTTSFETLLDDFAKPPIGTPLWEHV